MEFVGGSYTVSLSENETLVAERVQWSFQMVMSEGTFRMTIDGIDTESWMAEEDSLTCATRRALLCSPPGRS